MKWGKSSISRARPSGGRYKNASDCNDDNDDEETIVNNLPHPNNYKDWFTFYDEIDIRRHLQDIEIILIEAALEKTNGKIANAADILKLRRTTLIEKMKKFSIFYNKSPKNLKQIESMINFVNNYINTKIKNEL